MYKCKKCKSEVKVKKIKKGKGYCDQCDSFSVDLELHRLTKKYFKKAKNKNKRSE